MKLRNMRVVVNFGVVLLLGIGILGSAMPTLQVRAANHQPAISAIYSYGWEDGGTVLGSFGSNLVRPSNVASGDDSGTPVTPHSGSYMLQVTEEPHTGTPQAYLAVVEGLTDGDTVTASFYGWDSSSGATPSLRIWGHYTNTGDPDGYVASAGGNDIYTSGIGWEEVSYTWTFDSGGNTRDALVIEARLYSNPATDAGASTDYWIDDLVVDASAGTVIFPANGTYSLNSGSSVTLGAVGITNHSSNDCDFSVTKYRVPPGGSEAVPGTPDPGEMPLQWNVESSGCTDLDVDLTFTYADAELAAGNNITEGNLQAFRNSTGAADAWVAQGGSPDIVENTVRLSGVTALSSWTIADNVTSGNSDPTALTLNSLSASSSNGNIFLALVSVMIVAGSGMLWLRRRKAN